MLFNKLLIMQLLLVLFCFRWVQEMASNNLSLDDLKHLFEFIVRFDRMEGAELLTNNNLEKFNATINSVGQTKLVNALLDVRSSLS